MRASPIFLMMVMAIGFGVNPVLIKVLSQQVSIPAILFFRFLVVTAIFPLIALFVSHHTFRSLFAITKNQLLRFFLLSLLVVSNMYLFFASYEYITVNRAIFLFLTYPIFTLIFAYIFTREPIMGRDISATALSFVGVVFIFLNSGGFHGGNLIGDGMVILSSILWSAYIVLNRYTAAREMYWQQTLWMFVFITLLFLPLYLLLGNHESLFNLSLQSMGIIGFIAIVSTLIPYTIINYVSKEVKISTMGLLLLFSQTLSIFLSFAALKETPSPNVILGGALIVAAALMSIYSLEKLFSWGNYRKIMLAAGRKIASFKGVQIFFRK